MIKWLVYIVFLLVSAPCLLSAKTKKSRDEHVIAMQQHDLVLLNRTFSSISDTTKNGKNTPKADGKVKEVAKAKKQPKPEKVDDDAAKKEKPKRQKRPDGMERPPEIPRRNDN